ncbi:hypothetical protein [Luteimonas kalidii]|uniref:Lipoprotein n=1 Tax=Luteimonas kalidii TaxID=3042025 RepID=A0ABT6JXY3_9GAMM|nr:hypothetical protein [Luteimonas kalidii]MDH5835439.1 hypothetical protein [Luteimonas kalidii]
MKKHILATPLLVMLGACGIDKPPPAAPDTQPVEAETVSPESPARVSAEALPEKDPAALRLERFAEQLVADGKGHFRFNRIRDAKGGGKERQVFVEVVGLTDEQAADAAAQVLLGLGYEQGRRWSDENGVRIRFADVGDIPVSVLVRSREAHSGLNHDDSTASVYLTRPVGG